MGGTSQRSIGRRGEWAALVLLWLKGYRLRHRNWRCSSGELDLVMSHRGETVFVEVKTRSGSDFGGAAAAVDRAKQQRLARVAAAYLSVHNLWERPSRFDVVTVEGGGGVLRWRLRHWPNAFRPDCGRLM